MIRAVTFDFGQTLAELDTAFLCRRLGERAVVADPARLASAIAPAWQRYDAGIRAGLGGHPWKLLMRTLLDTAGAEGDLEGAIDWLWTEQPAHNLWRRPIAGMIELVRELREAGLIVGVVSNSEGRVAELAELLGWRRDFAVIADSGVLGIEKPDPAIFAWTAARLGCAADTIVHVGDSWAADIEGARNAGWRAIWFGGASGAPAAPSDPGDVPLTYTADDVRRALAALAR